jgi:hypothetical protein
VEEEPEEVLSEKAKPEKALHCENNDGKSVKEDEVVSML